MTETDNRGIAWLDVLRWVIFLPAGYAGAILLMTVIVYIRSADGAPWPWEPFIAALFLGGFLIYFPAKIAPEHRQPLAAIIALVPLLLLIFLGIIVHALTSNWSLLAQVVANLIGAMVAAVAVVRGDEWI